MARPGVRFALLGLMALMLMLCAIGSLNASPARAGEADLTIHPVDVDPGTVGTGVMTYPDWYDPIEFSDEDTTMLFSDNEPNQGDIVLINLTVFNVGLSTASAKVEFYDGPASSGALIGSDNVTVYPFNFDIARASWDTDSVTFENHKVYAYVLPHDPENEINDDNNFGNKPIVVNLRPIVYIGEHYVEGEQGVTVYEGDNVTLDGSNTVDTPPDMQAGLNYVWDFGDPLGNTSNPGSTEGVNLTMTSHTFLDSGEYVVNLTVNDHKGAVGEDTYILTVVNVVPDAMMMVVGNTFEEDEVIEFDASGSTDSVYDQDKLEYMWDWGNGASTNWMTEPTRTYFYTEAGTYEVTLTVRDDEGAEDETSTMIDIENRAPLASVDRVLVGGVEVSIVAGEVSVSEDDEVQFIAGFEDTVSDTATLEYSWRILSNTYDVPNPTHTFTSSGPVDVVLTITDDDGETGAAVVRVNVENIAPNADAGVDRVVQTSFVTFNASGSTDTASDVGTLTYSWDFGDGHLAKGKEVTHYFEELGSYEVQLAVRDDDNAVSFDTVNITIENISPVVEYDAPLDLDEDEVGWFSAFGSSDPNGLITSYLWEFADGVVLDGMNVSRVFYKTGVVGVNLTLTDDHGGTNTKSFTIRISNILPSADGGPDIEGYLGDEVTLDGMASNDTPSDKRNLTYQWEIDGKKINSSIVGFMPDRAGQFIATLRVWDDDEAISIDTVLIYIYESILESITITFELSPNECRPGKPVMVTGQVTYNFLETPLDLDVNVAMVTITVAGNPEVIRVAPGLDGTFYKTIYAPTQEGEYTVKVSITRLGIVGESTATLEVFEPSEPAPLVEFEPVYAGGAGLAVVAVVALGGGAFFAGTDIGRFMFFSMLIPLYSRLRKDKLLNNFERGRIYQFIIMNPGHHFSYIRDILEINSGVLTYHLKILEKEDYIKSRRDGMYKRFYPYEMKIMDGQPHDVQQLIMHLLAENPGLSQKQIAGELGLNVSTVNYHITMMVGAGVLSWEKKRRVRTYTMEGWAVDALME